MNATIAAATTQPPPVGPTANCPLTNFETCNLKFHNKTATKIHKTLLCRDTIHQMRQIARMNPLAVLAGVQTCSLNLLTKKNLAFINFETCK